MRLTIIPSDALVSVDNYFFTDLDLSSCNIPSNIHALQWYEVEGELEFVDNPDRSKPQNQLVSEIPTWGSECVAVWRAHKEYMEQEEARIALELEKAKAELDAKNSIPVTEI